MTHQWIAARVSRLFVKRVTVIGMAVAAVTMAWCNVASAQARRDVDAEQFVQAQVVHVLSVLNDGGQSQADKVRSLRAIIDQIADLPRISTFALGKYARTATPAQRERFDTVFRDYAEGVYATRLSEYHGESFKITGSVINRPGDVIVNTVIFGGKLSEPATTTWRVLASGTSWKVVDVQVNGIWLAITQQQDFVSTIDNNGGNIDVLIAQLERQGQQQAGSARQRPRVR
jgi:phospholipid transport system substrate-binding protein